jgi:hypothetical protein
MEQRASQNIEVCNETLVVTPKREKSALYNALGFHNRHHSSSFAVVQS